jgi:thermitase
MTTDATSNTPEPARPQSAAIHPEEDYPDPRSAAQRHDDEDIAAAQSAALTDSGESPHRHIDAIIRHIQEERQEALSLRVPNPPTQIEVLPRPGPPDRPDRPNLGDVILVVRGEMLLRVPAGGPPGPGGEPGAAAADEVPSPWRRADRLLRDLGYTQVSPDFPEGVPLRKYTVADRDAEQLLRDRDQVRAETSAEVDLNYVVTAGHLVKADDYPRGAAAVHRYYPPEWIRCHPVTRKVTVAVIDTGINHRSRTDGWLTGIGEGDANRDPLDVFPVRDDNGQIVYGDGVLDLSAGHGTFVAGVVEQVAPGCTIVVYRAVDTQGMGTSEDVANAIIQAADDGADIINASLGTMTPDNLPPVAFTTALDIVQAGHPDVLIVASAGNTGQELPMFPAAMKGVIGVGALAAKLTPAPWSNHGFWVNCSAVGIGVISTFVEGDEPHNDDAGQVVTEHFGPDAWAIWSGTSFSAPQIAGAVALLCQMNDVPPAVALGQLLAGKPILPGYGYVVPILPGT